MGGWVDGWMDEGQEFRHNFNSLDSVVGLHGPQEAIVEDGHEEALCHVVQVLSHCQYTVALSPGTGIQPTSLHSGAETADGCTLWQGQSLLEDTWGGKIT